jgi:hypothetical protein
MPMIVTFENEERAMLLVAMAALVAASPNLLQELRPLFDKLGGFATLETLEKYVQKRKEQYEGCNRQ